MDILLIQPPVHDFYLTQKRTIPYGLASIAASLEAEGFKTQIMDSLATRKSKPIPWPKDLSYLHAFYGRKDQSPFGLFHSFRHFGYSFQHIGKIARESGAFLIGISSLFTAYSNEALATAEIIKQWHPDCQIVIGGHHPTYFPKEVLMHPAIDFVLRGEAEKSMPALAKALKNNTPINTIPGIAYKKKDNSFLIHPPVILTDLDKLALPDYSKIQNKYYHRNDQKSLTVVGSRGCPMHCSYCALGDPLWIYRKKSVKRIIEEISSGAGNADAIFIDFEDENISLDRSWFMALMKQIHKNFRSKQVTLRAMNGLYPASLDSEMIDAMKQAGFNALNLSVGTLSQQQLKEFNRPDVSKQLPSILRTAQKLNLSTTAYIIAGGLNQSPYVSVDDMIALFRMGTVIGLSIFYPAPGSQDYQTLADKNMLPNSVNCMRGSAIPVSLSTSRVQSITLLRLTRILNFIHFLRSEKHPIPKPSKCTQKKMPLGLDRMQTGTYLLSWFFYDAVIRGVDADNTIYAHSVDTALAQYLKQFV